jgi:hypothetical protein
MPMNPYDPPQHGAWDETQFVQTDLARLTVAEIWRLGRPQYLAILGVLIAKALRRPVVTPFGSAPQITRYFDEEQLPERVWSSLRPDCEALESAGFRRCFFHDSPLLGDQEGYAVTLRHEQGLMWATLAWARCGREYAQTVVLASLVVGGRVISTTNARQYLKPAPHVDPIYLSGLDARALLRRHEERLEKRPRDALVWQSEEGLKNTLDSLGEQFAEFHRSRGVFRPMTHDEVQRIKQAPQPAR